MHDELLPGERMRFHAVWARALEGRDDPGGRRADRSVLIAAHWMAAHDSGRAFTASITAMRDSSSSLAHSAAAQMGERALELWDAVADAQALSGMTHTELLRRTAGSWRQAGEPQRSRAMVELALEEVGDGDRVERARLLRDKAATLHNDGAGTSVPVLEMAIRELGDADEPELRAGLQAELAAQYLLSGRVDDALVVSAEAMASVPENARRIRSVATNIHALGLTVTGHVEEGLAEFARAKTAAGDNPDGLLRYFVNYSDVLQLLGRFSDSLAVAEEGLEMARAEGLERTSGAIMTVNLVDPLFALGEWDRADELIDRALSLDPPPVFRLHLRRAQVRSLSWRGDPAGARPPPARGDAGQVLQQAGAQPDPPVGGGEPLVELGRGHDVRSVHPADGQHCRVRVALGRVSTHELPLLDHGR